MVLTLPDTGRTLPTPLDDADTKPSRSTLAIVTLHFLVLVNSMGKFALVMNIPFLLFAFGAPPATVGLVSTINGAASILGTVVWGDMSDRIGRKAVALPCQAAATALQAAPLLAPGPLALSSVASLYFFLSSGSRTAVAVYLADIVDPSELSVALGVMGAMDGVGTVTGLGLSGLFVDCGYACVAFVASSAALLMLAIGCVTLPPDPEQEADPSDAAADAEEKGSLMTDAAGALRNRRFRYMVSVHTVVNFGYTLYISSLALICHGTYGYTAVEFGQVSGAAGVVLIVFQAILLQRIIECLGESTCVFAGTLLRLVGSLIVATCLHPWAPLVSILVSSVGSSILEPSLMSMAVVATPEAGRGMAISTYRTASLLGESLGPLCAGIAYGFQPTLPCWVSAAMMAAGALGMLWADRAEPPTRGQMVTMIPLMTESMLTPRRKQVKRRTLIMLADAQISPLAVGGKFPSTPRAGLVRMKSQPLLTCEKTPTTPVRVARRSQTQTPTIR